MSNNNSNKKNASSVPSVGPGRGHGQNFSGQKPKNFKKTMKKLLGFLRPFYFKLVLVIIFSISSSVFAIFGPMIIGKGISQIESDIKNPSPNLSGLGVNFVALRNIILVLAAVYILSLLLGVIQNFILTNIAQRISYDFRKNLFDKINKLPLKYFDTNSTGDVMSRVTNDVDTITQTFNQSISQIITSITSVIGIVIMMFKISFPMTIIALLVIPTSLIVVSFIVKKSQVYFKEQQASLGLVNGQVEETFSGQLIVKVFSNEHDFIEKFSNLNNKLYKSAWKSQFFSGIMMPLMIFIGNIGYVAICVLGGFLVAKGRLTVGSISSFIMYVRSFNQPISQIAQISNLLQSTTAAAERVFEFLEEPEEVEDVKNPKSIKDIKGNVTFEDVNFGYNEDQLIIKDFSLDVNAGQKIAIVGPTGAGKTTLVKLLMRFYDINSGAIKIDGNNIKDFTRGDLRSLFSMVLQDTWLFSGTLKENIRYGNLNASDQDVINAAKAANVHHYIKTLPKGYDMVLNEETTNISQGQKQLITIARAILSDPKILILDEATSSVDTRTEVLIQEAMANLMTGRTSFVIAHRLSTIRNADVILVMDKGNIVEQGNHDELISKQGFYYKLYNSQFDEEAE